MAVSNFSIQGTVCISGVTSSRTAVGVGECVMRGCLCAVRHTHPFLNNNIVLAHAGVIFVRAHRGEGSGSMCVGSQRVKTTKPPPRGYELGGGGAARVLVNNHVGVSTLSETRAWTRSGAGQHGHGR